MFNDTTPSPVAKPGRKEKLKMKSYDKIPTLYRVSNIETGEVWELFAKDNLAAISQCPGGPESDPLTGPFRTEKMLTPEGYRITRLKLLPKGTYFNLVAARGKKPTPSRVYARGEYNRSAALYECCHFEDINYCRLLSGHTLVTIDMTF